MIEAMEARVRATCQLLDFSRAAPRQDSLQRLTEGMNARLHARFVPPAWDAAGLLAGPNGVAVPDGIDFGKGLGTVLRDDAFAKYGGPNPRTALAPRDADDPLTPQRISLDPAGVQDPRARGREDARGRWRERREEGWKVPAFAEDGLLSVQEVREAVEQATAAGAGPGRGSGEVELQEAAPGDESDGGASPASSEVSWSMRKTAAEKKELERAKRAQREKKRQAEEQRKRLEEMRRQEEAARQEREKARQAKLQRLKENPQDGTWLCPTHRKGTFASRADGARENGPFSYEELRAKVRQGKIPAGLSVFRREDELWIPLTEAGGWRAEGASAGPDADITPAMLDPVWSPSALDEVAASQREAAARRDALLEWVDSEFRERVRGGPHLRDLPFDSFDLHLEFVDLQERALPEGLKRQGALAAKAAPPAARPAATAVVDISAGVAVGSEIRAGVDYRAFVKAHQADNLMRHLQKILVKRVRAKVVEALRHRREETGVPAGPPPDAPAREAPARAAAPPPRPVYGGGDFDDLNGFATGKFKGARSKGRGEPSPEPEGFDHPQHKKHRLMRGT